jgi:hypothetical protein
MKVHGLILLLMLVAPGVPGAEEPELSVVLERLAARAEIHKNLLYQLHCVEEIGRAVHRSRESAAGFGSLPDQLLSLRHGLVIVRGESGMPREIRVKLDREGEVRLNKKGEPREIKLPPAMDPVAQALPHAQVASFTADEQARLLFTRLDPGGGDAKFSIACPDERYWIVEFLDRNEPVRVGPRSEPTCHAHASGQLCLDPENGEIAALEYYGLFFNGERCRWDFKSAFAKIRQDLVEESSGLRFPSEVETRLPISWRDTTVFKQRFTDCVFSDVHVHSSLDDPGSGHQ